MGQAGKGGGARYETVELIVSPAKFDGEVLALDIAAFLQSWDMLRALPGAGKQSSRDVLSLSRLTFDALNQ